MNRIAFAFALLAAFATAALAHEGPRVWIGNEAGRVTTYTSDIDIDPTVYIPSRLFGTDLEPFFGVYTTEFPGYEVRQDGGNVSPGTTFGFNITGPLLYYDAASQTFVTVAEAFGPPLPGPVPQMAITLGASIRATAAGPAAGFNFFSFNVIGDHSHLAYTLLGDGVTASDGPAGVYALSLELTSPALATSQTYYLLIGKDVEQTDDLFAEAWTVALQTLVSDAVPGDLDCSGTRDAADVAAFVQALIDPTAYAAAHPNCNAGRADVNQDGTVDGRDVQAMVRLLVN